LDICVANLVRQDTNARSISLDELDANFRCSRRASLDMKLSLNTQRACKICCCCMNTHT